MSYPISDPKAGTVEIENFLIEYLGTPTQPVPFGGRAAELAALDAWLADPNAPPYALLTGQAGRGKSALLVRWADSLVKRDLARVVFVPINIRFNTALKSVTFTTLAARLSEIYGEPVKQADLSAEQWHEVCRSYLNRTPPPGNPLVVILDGLDQAADWQAGPGLFPERPPPDVRVVVSVRSGEDDLDQPDWLHRLGWDKFDVGRRFPLSDLSQSGVNDVLATVAAQFDRPATREAVMNELLRLSQGDPLVLRLHVDALTSRAGQVAALSPGDLKTLKPGLDGYIRRWDANLRRRYAAKPRLIQAVRVLINLCATALGPLTQQDLLTLAPDALTDDHLLEEAVRAADNFIIEDEVRHSYAFGHLRLGEFFIAQLSPEEQQAWQDRFLIYGRETLAALEAGTLRPDDAPAYIVQYYGAHLSRAAAPASDFYALLNHNWLNAWLRMEDSYSGFLNDVERAWQQAEVEGDIPIQILCLLCQTSVATLSVNIPPLLLALAVQHELITPPQALAIARLNPEEVRFIRALIELIPYLPESLLKYVLTELRVTSNVSWKTTALLKLASHFSDEELRKEAMLAALETAQSTDDVFLQMDVLNQITPHLPAFSDLRAAVLEQALAQAYAMPRRDLSDDSPKAKALMGVAPHLSPELREEALSKAYEVALSLGDDRYQARRLVDLVPLMPESMKIETIRAALRPIAHAYGYKAYQSWRAEELTELAPHLPESLHQEALLTARVILNLATRVEALAGLLPVLSPQLQETALQEAIAATQRIRDDYDWVMAVSRLAPFLPEQLKHDMLDQALKKAQAETRQFPRARQLAHVGIHLSEPLKTQVLREALAIVLKFEYEYEQSVILPTFASHLTKELLAEVLGTRSAADERVRAEILSDLTLHLASLGALGSDMLPATMAAVLALPQHEGSDKSPRAEALIALAPHLPDTLKAEALSAIKALPQNYEDDRILRAKSLAGLLPHLPGPLKEEATQELLLTMRELPKGKYVTIPRMKLMTHIPFQLPEPLSSEAWQDALSVVRAVPFDEWRVSALIKLTPHLPTGMKKAALAMIREMERGYVQAETLAGIAPHLPDNLMKEALAIIPEIRGYREQGQALLGLAPHLPETLKPEALALARTIARGIGKWGRDRVESLIGLLPHLPATMKPDVLDEALEMAREIDDAEDRVKALTGLLPHLSETTRGEVLREALAGVREIAKRGSVSTYDYVSARLIVGLAPYLPDGQMQQDALSIVQNVKTPGAQVEGWIGLVPHLPVSEQAEIVESAQKIEAEYLRSKLLIGLMPHLPDTSRAKVLDDAQAIGNTRIRVQTMYGITRYLPDTLKAEALINTLASVKMLEEIDRVEALINLTPHLPAPLWSEFLSVSQTFAFLFSWRKLLEGAVPYMPDQTRAEALRLTHAMESKHWAFKALAVPLAEWARSQPEAAYMAWRETLRHLAPQSRRDVLLALHALMPFTLALVEESEQAQAAEEIFQVIKKVEEWWPKIGPKCLTVLLPT